MTLMRDEAVQPFQRIVQGVRKKIASGQYRPGDKLQSTRELADEYGVAPGTVQRALSELRTAGVIYSHQGRGSFVAESASGVGNDATARAIADLEAKVAELTERLDKLEGSKAPD
jgi:GntR family transcriptional regulator